jgi:hypothetical protein
VFLIAAAGAAVFIVWGLPAVLTRHPHLASASDWHKAISRTRTGLIALVVAAGGAGGLAYAAWTHRLSREGHLTDRYSKAVEQLGDDKLEVRLGGIYALERLMADSDRDQPTILEVLAAWVRDRTDSRKVPEHEQPEKVPIDIQAAMTVIGRRRSLPVSVERPIDLCWTVLRQADLVEARLTRAELKGDRQHAVHEREPHLMVPFAAFGGERQGGEDPFRLDEVRSCGDGLVWDG